MFESLVSNVSWPRGAARAALCAVIGTLAGNAGARADDTDKPERPNVIIIFADDMGYGDVGCYGHPSIRTPNLDQLAVEGMRFTSFYVADNVCTPSRAALMTGRLPIRNGMYGKRRRVFVPESTGGLPLEEITIAEALRGAGYRTKCVGKWHLGSKPEFLPTRQGFESYFGVPYSNDMNRPRKGGRAEPPLLRDEAVFEQPAEQTTLTRRYTDESVRFLREHRDEPMFLYLAHTFPHVPLFASKKFRGTSSRGLYGDVVEEIDASVGEIVATLRELKIADRTLIVFTSDNGPWLSQKLQGGSAGLLREGKGSTWEGGMRVPAIAWWPGRIPAGTTCRDIVCSLDVFPTVLGLAGVPLPEDRPLDGVDVSKALFEQKPSPRTTMPFYRGGRLMAYRSGPYKIHRETQPGYGSEGPQKHDPPLLFHLNHDPGENFNVNERKPEIVAKLKAEIEAFERDHPPVASIVDEN